MQGRASVKATVTGAVLVDNDVESRFELRDDGEVVSAGTGAACMGHPVNAVAWLANAVAEQGEPLQAGEIDEALATGDAEFRRRRVENDFARFVEVIDVDGGGSGNRR